MHLPNPTAPRPAPTALPGSESRSSASTITCPLESSPCALEQLLLDCARLLGRLARALRQNACRGPCPRRALRQAEQQAAQLRDRQAHERFLEEERQLAEQPHRLLERGLHRLAQQWLPASAELLAGGAGIGRADLLRACSTLQNRFSRSADRTVAAVWNRWIAGGDRPCPQMAHAVRRVLNDVLQQTAAPDRLAPSGLQRKSARCVDGSPYRRTSTPFRPRTRSTLQPSTPTGRPVAK